MRIWVSVVVIWSYCTFSFGQNEAYAEIAKRYDRYIQNIEKDTTLVKRYSTYKCGEEMLGSVTMYYKKDSLQLMHHTYKQGIYDEYHNEFYYLEQGQLVLQTTFTEVMHLNTNSTQSAGTSSFAVEKVLELKEQRTVYPEKTPRCYQRSFGAKLSDWDQEYFQALPFQETECDSDMTLILDRYRTLCKAERFFKTKITKAPPCIFYLW